MSQCRVSLYDYQMDALKRLDTRHYGVMICHRRWGKTVLAVSRLCRNAANGGETYRGAYLAPTYRQAKDVAWDYIRKIAVAAGANINISELSVEFSNGARIRLYGAENPDSLRGLNLCDVVIDEVAQMPRSVWTEIILPMLVSTQGSALFVGTPKGKNLLLSIWEEAKTHPDQWVALMFKASDTHFFTEETLSRARRSMSEEEYLQEYECSFTASVKGSYYGKLIEQAEHDGRICGVPYNPGSAVITAWDLGFSDSTAIWFAQVIGQEVHVIDYYASSGVGLDHYARVLREKGYVYGDHIFPHDVAVSELGTGTTRLETLRKLGLPGRILKATRVDDGINAVRMLLPRCWFDLERCESGLDALRMYQRDWDEKAQDFRSSPRHDWTSHSADAFRYLATGIDTAAATVSGRAFAPLRQNFATRLA